MRSRSIADNASVASGRCSTDVASVAVVVVTVVLRVAGVRRYGAQPPRPRRHSTVRTSVSSTDTLVRDTGTYAEAMGDFAAVLWDLDGTLIDSEPLWMAGEHELAESHGASWTQEDGLALVGNSLIESGHYIKKRLGSDLSAEEIVDFLVARLADDLSREIPWRPGARGARHRPGCRRRAAGPGDDVVRGDRPAGGGGAAVRGRGDRRPGDARQAAPRAVPAGRRAARRRRGRLPRHRGLRHRRHVRERGRLPRAGGAALRQRAGRPTTRAAREPGSGCGPTACATSF